MTPRVAIAALAGVGFLTAWITAAVLVADVVHHLHPALQFAYFAAAGFAWVFPVWWLMLWAARTR